MRQPLALSIVQLQAMRAGYSTQIAFQGAIQNHLRILEWSVVDEPVHFGSHGYGGIEAVLNAGSVDPDGSTVSVAQLDAGGVDVEFA